MAIYDGYLWEMSRVASPELVVNGDFASDTRWTKPTGVTISGGKLNVSAATGKCYQSGGNGISLTSGKTYIFSFQVSAWSAGSFRTYIQSTPVYTVFNFAPTQANGTVQAIGHYWFRAVCTSTSATSEFGIDFTGFTGTIDNFSIKEVDTTLLTYKSNWASSPNYHTDASTYLPMEFSYSDPGNNGKYTIIGGSDFACEVGASVLLRALGFRFFAQTDQFVYRPASITTGLSRAKAERTMRWSSWGVNYGYGWGDPYVQDRYVLNGQYEHWTYMVGGAAGPDPHGHRYEDIYTSNYAYFVANPTLLRQITGTTDPYANATLHFYVTGTLTPATTYSDAGLTTSNPNPITLTSTGTLPNAVYFDPGVDYKMVHKNALGTTITTTDPVEVSQLTWPTPTLTQRRKTLNLDGTYGTADWDNLVNLCAAYLYTSCAAHQTFSTHFDSLDGSDFGTDLTVEFTNAVVAKIRSGADAIPGYYSARPALPLARLGLLAYNDHAGIPTVDVHEGVYVQLTVAFLNGLEFNELHAGWSAKTAEPLSVYYYPTLITYSGGNLPMYEYMAKTDGDAQAASVGYPPFNMEYGPNWITNFVFVHWINVQAIVGGENFSYDDALEEVVTTIFDDDDGVRDLFNFWGLPYTYLTEYTLSRSFDIIDTMTTSWYKDAFKKYITFAARWRRAQVVAGMSAGPTAEWPYVAAAEPLLYDLNAWNVATRMEGWMSGFAWFWYWGLWKIQEYPDVRYGEDNGTDSPTLPDPLVGWFTDPYYPDDTDYDEEKAHLASLTSRSANLEDTTRVLVTGLTLTASGSYSAKNNQLIVGAQRLFFVGPGTLTLTALRAVSTSSSTYYGTGVHEVIANGYFTASCSGGYIFIDGYYYPQRDVSGSIELDAVGHSFIFIQRDVAGSVKMESENVAYLADKSGEFILFSDLTENPAPSNLGPGLVVLDDVRSHLRLQLGNVNPFISQDPNVMLMPLDLVEAEFDGLIKVTIA